MPHRLLRLIAAVFFLLPVQSLAQSSSTFGQYGADSGLVCDGDYALCTSAECTPDPDNPTAKAVCDCTVENGQNYGVLTTCAARTAVETSGTTLLVSTYSFAQAATKDVMTCTGANYWTDCLDAPCVVDPRDPTKAICTCNLISPDNPNYNQAFVTYGGGCDTSTCQPAYWSGATAPNFAAGSDALMKVLGIDPTDKDAVPFTFCVEQSD